MSQLFIIEGKASTWKEALKLTSQKLLEKGCVNHDFYKSCVERELLYPTGLTETCPIAIPHTTKEYVIKQAICALRLEHPVKFRSMENVEQEIDVKYVLNLALLDDGEHIRIVSRMITCLKDKAFIEKMNTLPVEQLGQFLTEKFLNE